MAFEWVKFFEQYRVEYRDTGANVSKDNVVVHCPFCGPQDTSMHMSVNLVGRGWRCWRHPQHRGKNPARLVQSLIHCTYERAQEIVGQTVYIPGDFMQQVRNQFEATPVVSGPAIKIPPEFKPFTNSDGLPSVRPFARYLRERGFSFDDVDRMTKRYGVYYVTRGPYSGRIVFTVRHENELISWTGRTIYPNQELRYKTLSIDAERSVKEDLPPARGAISHFLLWYDKLMSADAETLLLVEGPFDALKVDVLGRRHGVRATCFFTSSPTDKQVDLLHELCPRYKRRILLLDRGTLALGLRIASTLSTLGIVTRQTPPRLKDPGEFDTATFSDFMFALDRTTR